MILCGTNTIVLFHSNGPLTDLPDSMMRLTKLQVLRIIHQSLQRLP